MPNDEWQDGRDILAHGYRRSPISASLEQLAEQVKREERSRIRTELLAAVEAGTYDLVAGLHVAEPFLDAAEVRAAIDRIIPPQDGEP